MTIRQFADLTIRQSSLSFNMKSKIEELAPAEWQFYADDDERDVSTPKKVPSITPLTEGEKLRRANLLEAGAKINRRDAEEKERAKRVRLLETEYARKENAVRALKEAGYNPHSFDCPYAYQHDGQSWRIVEDKTHEIKLWRQKKSHAVEVGKTFTSNSAAWQYLDRRGQNIKSPDCRYVILRVGMLYEIQLKAAAPSTVVTPQARLIAAQKELAAAQAEVAAARAAEEQRAEARDLEWEKEWGHA